MLSARSQSSPPKFVKHAPWLLLLILPAFLCQAASAQSVVSPGGAGSYASSVPAADQNTDAYYALPASQVTGSGSFFGALKLDPALAGKPIPTNHWWTDLLVGNRSAPPADPNAALYTLQQDPYGGSMWFYPGKLNPRSYGFDLYYPTQWQNNPTSAAVDPGPALQVHGDRGYTVPPGDILVADFETSYPAGWTVTSFAGYTNPFGSVPSQAAWGHGIDHALGQGRLDRFNLGPNQSADGYRGMIAGDITIQKHYLNLLVGGGNDPANLYVRLKVNGNVVYTATGQQSASVAWVTWDVSAYLGQTARIEIVDNSSSAYGFIACDEIVQSDSNAPATRYGTDFIAAGSVVTNWGDWNVDFRLADASGLEADVTMVRGVPFTWSTWKGGMKPKITGLSGVQFLDASGGAISTAGGSFVASAFAFNYQGRAFGVFLPDNTTVTVGADYIEPQLSGTNNYMVIGYLPATSNLAEFNAVAFARPTDTKLAWTYNPANGYVATTWNLATTAMKGTNLNTIQGWLPHHYRTTTGLPTFNSYSYLTATGAMKCATGTNFNINFPFRGLAPVLPAPVATGAANDFQPARMQQYLTSFQPGSMLGETYGSGKALGLCAQIMSEAAQSGDTANFNRLKNALETALANWFTYTPGEETNGQAGYFASYPDWKALIGFDASYGSQAFNDLHFHYGYFTSAVGLLGMYDPQFVANYAPMIRLIAKTYANYDRNDLSDPFLRTFDVWEGHSNAGGLSSEGGENQESSSEGVQSWAGLFLLGNSLNDSQMVAAGAMGFAMETAATNEYWQDTYGTNRPSTFTKGIAGMVWGGHTDYATYFSADPAWVYGIQYVPSNHWLSYLTRNQTPAQITAKYNTMWNEREAWANANPTWNNATAYPDYQWVKYNSRVYSPNGNIPAGHAAPDVNAADWYYQADYGRTEPDILGAGLSPYVLLYQALFDPDTAAAEFDRYYAANEQIVQGGTGATDYYLIHALRQVGQQDFNSYTSIPTSAVYRNAATGKVSYVVYNPASTQQNVTVYQNGSVVGTFPVPARTTINSHLDQTLTTLVMTPATPTAVLPPGQTLQFNLTGYDQYGATYPVSGTTFTASAGGTINASGLFTATANAYPVTVTATVGSLTQSYTFRVGAASVLSAVNVAPGFTRVTQGATQPYTATGVDQYGNPFGLGTVAWSTSGGVGTADSTGLFSASTLGTGYVTATSGGISGSVVVAVHAPLANAALGRQAFASTSVGGNVPNNATDGNATSTRWESTSADGQYLYVDLGKVYDLTRVYVVWEPAYAANYDVQASLNGTDWTLVHAAVSKTNSSPDDLAISGTGRYLKLGLNTRATGYGFSVYELQVYGYPNAVSVTPSVLRVNPPGLSLPVGQQATLQAYAFDANQDGGATAAASWAVSGGGTISAAGVFNATTAGGPFTATATLGSLTATSSVTVTGGQTPPTQGTLTNVALNQAATASSTVGNNRPGLAVDGNKTGTRWESASTDNESWTVDLGASIPLAQVAITWEAAYGRQYNVLGSNDAASWTVLKSQTAGAGGTETFTVSGTYRYVRMQGVQRATGYGYSFYEFQVLSYSPPQRTNKALANGVMATASSSQGAGNTPNYAIDGDQSTRWASAATDGESITLNLGTPQALTQVALSWEAAYGKQYNVLGSNDGTNWTLLQSQTNGTGGLDVFNVSGTYQYVRMQGVLRGTGYGYSLYEFQVY